MNYEMISKEDFLLSLRNGGFDFIEKFLGFSFIENKFEINENFKYSLYTVVYESKQAKRFLNLRVSDFTDKRIISVYVLTHTDENGRFGSIECLDYLGKVLGLQNINEQSILDNYKGNSLSEKVQSFFVWLDSVLDERLEKILRGKDWIDIPFDWGPYK